MQPECLIKFLSKFPKQAIIFESQKFAKVSYLSSYGLQNVQHQSCNKFRLKRLVRIKPMRPHSDSFPRNKRHEERYNPKHFKTRNPLPHQLTIEKHHRFRLKQRQIQSVQCGQMQNNEAQNVFPHDLSLECVVGADVLG